MIDDLGLRIDLHQVIYATKIVLSFHRHMPCKYTAYVTVRLLLNSCLFNSHSTVPNTNVSQQGQDVGPSAAKTAPTPTPRTSLLKKKDGDPGTSSDGVTHTFKPKAKFKAAGYAAQASIKAKNYQKGSKACDIL
jgi:hypothetical protein